MTDNVVVLCFYDDQKSQKQDARFFCRLCDYHCNSLQYCEMHVMENRHKRLKAVSSFLFVILFAICNYGFKFGRLFKGCFRLNFAAGKC
jgi:hypothetical protein